MNDERETLSPSEKERIDVKDAWQVLWWCRSLNITKTQLEIAIEAVGDEPDNIRQFISHNH
jgi:hypothetical protein